MKVLIQNKRTRWFTARTLRSAFVQGIVRVGYSPLFVYYELLVIANEINNQKLKLGYETVSVYDIKDYMQTPSNTSVTQYSLMTDTCTKVAD